ncbi:MAG: hypothetical protein FJ361_08480 [Gemmatimonadetes bacterium]|nr:hypothetical protein [Gemmatimonadota bacterium]
MSLSLAAAVFLQVAVSVDVSSSGGSVSAGVKVPRTRATVVTEAQRATAFKDSTARTLLLRARAARVAQDSALRAYDVTSYQRLSLGLGLRAGARDRLAYRSEGAARVQWERGRGAHVNVLGARLALPIAQGTPAQAEAESEAEDAGDFTDVMAIPYYPGMDELWLFNMFGNGNEDGDDAPEEGTYLIHPIAEGSEATYTFASGDSMTIALPGGRAIQLRELRAMPRSPSWNAVAASLWFELDEAHLVRAALRFSDRLDAWELVNKQDSTARSDVPLFARPLVTPLQLDLTGMTIEYGLYEGRFWMPRLQGAEFATRVSAFRVPLTIEQRFQYASVNGDVSFPSLANVVPPLNTRALRDSLRAAGLADSSIRDSVMARFATRDTLERRARERQCAEGDRERVLRSRYQGVRMPVIIDLPCDRSTLATSEALPPSIYDAGDQLFGAAEREEVLAMLNEVLPRGTLPSRPRTTMGLGLTRYNRVEGLGTGIAVDASLGRGWRTSGLVRGALGDRRLNGDVRLLHDRWGSAWEIGAYRRLDVSSDFGDPLSFGASFATLLYGRDEGFYHRATGVELVRRPISGRGVEWRVFTDHQRTADVMTRFSLFSGGDDPRMGTNVAAEPGTYSGIALRWRGGMGEDPAGWRVAGDFRFEGATGRTETFPAPCRSCLIPPPPPPRDRSYGRVYAEGSVSRGLGPLAAALTVAGGTTSGRVPTQRAFFLGGLHSVRGLSAGTRIGEAMWLARTELGVNRASVRPVVFYDIGWAGPRAEWRAPETLLRGAGMGLSLLDGLLRFDVSRGIAPVWQTRVDLSVEARF